MVSVPSSWQLIEEPDDAWAAVCSIASCGKKQIDIDPLAQFIAVAELR